MASLAGNYYGWQCLAVLEGNRGDVPAARRHFERCAAANPDNAAMWQARPARPPPAARRPSPSPSLLLFCLPFFPRRARNERARELTPGDRTVQHWLADERPRGPAPPSFQHGPTVEPVDLGLPVRLAGASCVLLRRGRCDGTLAEE